MKAKPRVVAVIDDDRDVQAAISRLLWPHGYDTAFYASAGDFLDALPTEAICLIVDLGPGESCAEQLAESLVRVGFTRPIIVTTADCNDSFKRQAMELGCVTFLPKPISAEVLVESLRDIPSRPLFGVEQPSPGRALDTGLFPRGSSRHLGAALRALQQTIQRLWTMWLRDLSR